VDLGAVAENPEPDPPAAARSVSTVACPEAVKRPVCLAECIALALENGRTGEFYDRPGSDRRTSVTGLQRLALPAGATDSIRVFAYDPAIANTETEESLAKFDAVWNTNLDWNHVSPPQGLSAAQVPPVGALNNNGLIDNAMFRTELLKPLPTGGVAGLTFRTDYEKANLSPGSPIINPAWQPGVELSFEQPLLQGAGVFLNQLRETRPESLLHPNLPPGARVPGILLARLAHDQAGLEFERRVQDLLFAVEEAYWQLYCSYWELYSRENAMKQAHTVWMIARSRYEARGGDPEELAQAEEQYQFFRAQRLEALGRGTPGRPGVLEAERRLRYVVGLPPEDGTRLIPSDTPVTAPVEPDWAAAVADAMTSRPEIVQIGRDIRATELTLARARSLLLPDLRLVSRYAANGVAGEFGDAFHNLAHTPFSSGELRLQLQVPLGFREGHAEVTRARLQLSQRIAFLHDQEAKVVLSLQRATRDVVQYREEIDIRRGQRRAAALQVRARYDKYRAGKGSIEFLLQAQRTWADSLRDEYLAVCNYNIALADFERQKGTIMRYDNVKVAEAPLSASARPHASAHIHQASLAAARTNPEPTTAAGGGSRPAAGPDTLDVPGFDQPPRLTSLELLDPSSALP
jgi:outer membrane protein TolC